jgi:hypothetical protein
MELFICFLRPRSPSPAFLFHYIFHQAYFIPPFCLARCLLAGITPFPLPKRCWCNNAADRVLEALLGVFSFKTLSLGLYLKYR